MVTSKGARLPLEAFWSGRNVLVTGHTGFKGAWLSRWLAVLGAKVSGISLEPPTSPNLYTEIALSSCMQSDLRVDIRDYARLCAAVNACQPSIVFHLAAQSLVRLSYHDPLSTFSTNVLGTANVLEAARHCSSISAVLVVTTDKCYENEESTHRYREGDRLGGYDPYSSSKACAELVTDCWRKSYETSGQCIASARAGNVIGAGDWSADRLLPDCFRSFAKSIPVYLRFPQATRPWQHVLEPLNGYILLAESLSNGNGSNYAQAWNFGPLESSEASVGDVARLAAEAWGQGATVSLSSEVQTLHEAGQLRLDSSLALERLNWGQKWSLPRAVHATAEGYRKQKTGLRDLIDRQIREYMTGQE